MPESTNAVPAVVGSFIADRSFDERNAVLKTLANAAGMRLPTTRVPEGDSLLPIGEEAKRALQADVAQLPGLRDGLMALRDVITGERAQDVKVPIQAVRMHPLNGGLFGEGKRQEHALAYTARGFSQVAQFVKPASIRNGFSENLLALPTDLRAEVFNHWSTAQTRKQDVVLRTYRPGGGRAVVRAVTSEVHSLSTGDDLTVLGALMGLPAGAKLRATRSVGGDRSELEVIWPAMERQLVVGDVAMLALRITNSETKGGCLQVEPTLLRVLCYNFTTAWADGLAEDMSLRHVGDLGRKLPRLIKRAGEVLEPFVKAFGDAYRSPMSLGRGEVLERARKALELPAETVSTAARVWDADGAKSAGNTLAGLAHALTRAS